jgi:xanthine dehydrogenase FAD-binding subunit
MYDISKYEEATSVEEALRYLGDDPDSIAIAAGSDVLIKIREGKLAGASLVSIIKIEELKSITLDEKGNIHIGPLVNFTQLEEDAIIKEYINYLGQAGGTMGGPQLRNIASIGGNVCNGATSADSGSTLVCLNAQLELTSEGGQRIVPISEFYLGPGKVDLKPGELLTDIVIRKEDYAGYEGKYTKFAQRKSMDIATIGCAVMIKKSGNKIEDLRLGYGVASPTPVRCPKTEAFAKGLELTEENAKAIGEHALMDVSPRDSWRGSKAYREQLIKVLAERAIIDIAKGGGE